MLSLDHIIWAGDNIEQINQTYGVNFAVKSVMGGEHEAWGTFNYLTHLSNNCYLEWLGVKDLELAKRLNHPLIEHLVYTLETGHQGPFQFALRTAKMEEHIKHFIKKDIPFTGPVTGERSEPNGKTVSWSMLFPHYDYKNDEILPFLIQWDQPENKRVDVSLINHQAITDIYFSGVNKDYFTTVFRLPNKKKNNRIHLPNTNIHFTNDDTLLRMNLT